MVWRRGTGFELAPRRLLGRLAHRRNNVCGSQWLNTLMGDSLKRNRPCNYHNSEST